MKTSNAPSTNGNSSPHKRVLVTRRFLRLLFGQALARGHFLNIWTKTDKRSQFLRNSKMAAIYSIKRSKESDVYCGMGLLAKSLPPNCRGSVDDIAAIVGLWADVDISNDVHKKSGVLPQGKKEALELIKRIGLEPTCVIFTGHGYQCFWLFPEPWEFISSMDRTEAAALAKSWIEHIQRVAASQGYAVDPVGDLLRVLRVPGTINRKAKPFVSVSIVSMKKQVRYLKEDFQKLFRAETIDGFVREDLDLLKKAILSKNGSKFGALWRGDTSHHSNDQSSSDLALCGMLAFWTGGDKEVMDRLFRQSGLYREKWDEKHSGDGLTYGEMTIAKALESKTDFYKSGGPGPKPITQEVLKIAEDAELFHNAEGEVFATVNVKTRAVTFRIKSDAFKEWLAGAFYEKTHRSANDAAIKDAINVLANKAKYDGFTHEVAVRICSHDDGIIIDLGDDTGRVIEVKSTGWDVLDRSPVRFIRTNGMLPLVEPTRGGKIEELFPFVNIREKDRVLFLAWILSALCPKGPYAVLVLGGEQGAGKSTLFKIIRLFIDPNKAAARSVPEREQDLVVAVHNSWLIIYDNISYIEPWLSDVLSQISTGGSFSKRKNYTDLEEILVHAERPIALGGIGELVTRSDLLDRSIVLMVPQLEDSKRISERSFWEDFEKARPRILGALLDVLVVALRKKGKVKFKFRPRMLDFMELAVAAEVALGFEAGTFEKAYRQNRNQSHYLALEASVFGPYIRELLKANGGKWVGEAAKLLQKLGEFVRDCQFKPRGWPTNAKSLSDALRRIAPNLRAVGISVQFKKGTRRIITLEQI